MSETQQQQVYVWGFSAADLHAWPPDLVPVPTHVQWPADASVVVHARAALEFQRQAELNPLPDGSGPDAILYLPHGMQEPTGTFFDAVVLEGEWSVLRELLSCPKQFRMAALATVVPTRLLDRLPEHLDLESLDLSEEAREHLSGCAICRAAFNRTVAVRRTLRQNLLHPALERLAAYLRGAADPWVARHLGGCQECAGLVRVLRPRGILLKRSVEDVLAGVVGSARRELGAFAALVDALLRQGWLLSGSGAERPNIATSGPVSVTRSAGGQDGNSADQQAGKSERLLRAELLVVLDTMLARDSVSLTDPTGKGDLTWTLVWSEQVQDEIIELRGAERIEVRRGPQVLWQAHSDQDHIVLPMSELEQLFQAGADQIDITPS